MKPKDVAQELAAFCGRGAGARHDIRAAWVEFADGQVAEIFQCEGEPRPRVVDVSPVQPTHEEAVKLILDVIEAAGRIGMEVAPELAEEIAAGWVDGGKLKTAAELLGRVRFEFDAWQELEQVEIEDESGLEEGGHGRG